MINAAATTTILASAAAANLAADLAAASAAVVSAAAATCPAAAADLAVTAVCSTAMLGQRNRCCYFEYLTPPNIMEVAEGRTTGWNRLCTSRCLLVA